MVVGHCHVEKRCEEIQVLTYRKIRIEREASGHIADPAAYAPVAVANVESGYGGIALIRIYQCGEDTEHGRFSCAVRTYQPEQFAAAHRERDVVESGDRSVGFAYVSDLYGVHSLTSPYMPNLMCPSFFTAIFTA